MLYAMPSSQQYFLRLMPRDGVVFIEVTNESGETMAHIAHFDNHGRLVLANHMPAGLGLAHDDEGEGIRIRRPW